MFAVSGYLPLRVGCVILAMLGILMLLGAMVGFEQHRRGRLGMLVAGGVLVAVSTGAVVLIS